MGKLDGNVDAVFADMDMPQRPGAALLVGLGHFASLTGEHHHRPARRREDQDPPGMLSVGICYLFGGDILQNPRDELPGPQYLILIIGQAVIDEAQKKTNAKQKCTHDWCPD